MANERNEIPTAIIVLKALMMGLPVPMLDLEEVRLDTDNDLCMPMYRLAPGQLMLEDDPSAATKFYMKIGFGDITLGQFIRECAKMSEADRLGLVANITLNSMPKF